MPAASGISTAMETSHAMLMGETYTLLPNALPSMFTAIGTKPMASTPIVTSRPNV